MVHDAVAMLCAIAARDASAVQIDLGSCMLTSPDDNAPAHDAL
jgi:hypothetical protein